MALAQEAWLYLRSHKSGREFWTKKKLWRSEKRSEMFHQSELQSQPILSWFVLTSGVFLQFTTWIERRSCKTIRMVFIEILLDEVISWKLPGAHRSFVMKKSVTVKWIVFSNTSLKHCTTKLQSYNTLSVCNKTMKL